MRVAIDARGVNWYKGTGIGTYTENLIKNLLQLDLENYYHLYWCGSGYTDFKNNLSKISMSSKKYTHFFEQYYFPSNLEREHIDIYHVPQNGIGLSENIKSKKVITIHDLIPYIMPETVGKGYLLKFLREIPKNILLADAILTVSEWSKKDILRFFPIDENKIFVTPLAADKKYKPLNREKCKNFIKKSYNIDSPFILYIGGFSPRKNVKALLLAFSKIYSALNKEHRLVIVGAKQDEGNYLSSLGTTLDISSKIIFTGFVPENHLPILYNASEAFVYPSLYEGFGLPPLEAMSCGTPVITSALSSIPEVVQDAGILIDPYVPASLEEALLSVLNNESLKNELRLKGLSRAVNFSWNKTAESTLAIYKKIYDQTA